MWTLKTMFIILWKSFHISCLQIQCSYKPLNSKERLISWKCWMQRPLIQTWEIKYSRTKSALRELEKRMLQLEGLLEEEMFISAKTVLIIKNISFQMSIWIAVQSLTTIKISLSINSKIIQIKIIQILKTTWLKTKILILK